MNPLATIRKHRIWQKYNDAFIVLFITVMLFGIYCIVFNIFNPGWIANTMDISFDVIFEETSTLPDLEWEFSIWLSATLWKIHDCAMALSLLITALAAYFTATNDQINLPIRLLATAENAVKFVFALGWTSSKICYRYYFNIGCSEQLSQIVFSFNDFVLFYDFSTIAQYCQLLISTSRFFAVAFDGFYFRHTQKQPFLQLLLPFLLGATMVYGNQYFREILAFYGNFNFKYVLYYVMCGMDFVTNWNMKKFRSKGGTTRAEKLLMIQMLVNSYFNLQDTILLYSIVSILHLFFGPNTSTFFMDLTKTHNTFFFFLISSLITIFCLHRGEEKSKGSKGSKSSVSHITVSGSSSSRKKSIRSSQSITPTRLHH